MNWNTSIQMTGFAVFTRIFFFDKCYSYNVSSPEIILMMMMMLIIIITIIIDIITLILITTIYIYIRQILNPEKSNDSS